jgi:M6 family metalloprotease-like protein
MRHAEESDVIRTTAGVLAFLLSVSFAAVSDAMQPPTREQLERYRLDGTLAARGAAARAVGNHLVSPHLSRRLDREASAHPVAPVGPKKLPSSGIQRVFAVLVGFADYPGHNPPSQINRRLFRQGPDNEFPYESLRDFYRRSSHGLLELDGVTLGWYRAPYRRSVVNQTDAGREGLIREVIRHFDQLGHDFSVYDNDGDGQIEYFLVIYAGPRQDWGDFWWGYQRHFDDSTFVVDGVHLGAYSWQWESPDGDGPFHAGVAIHETGHALGLPDYYDYDDDIGPRGGLGGLDMMDSNWADHGAFSKFLLGWIDPVPVNEGLQRLALAPADSSGDAVLLMHGNPVDDPRGEFFIAQYRRRSGNDRDVPANGVLIWHIDARVGPAGRFLFDNSYTDHKLIRLMEADGLEEIEQGLRADAGDFYTYGDVLSPTTIPDSDRYDGVSTNLSIDTIRVTSEAAAFDVDLGSGCGIFGESPGPVTGWPEIATRFRAELEFENCPSAERVEWDFGDGSEGAGAVVDHRYGTEGRYSWALEASAGDAELERSGDVLVCSDPRCYHWRPEASMTGPRLQHSAVVLADGRVFVVGGGPPPEIFDPATGEWQPSRRGSGDFPFASAQLLLDDRVLVTGSSAGNPINAEIFDPATGTWSATGRMNTDRVMHSTVRLRDGRVLVAGGEFEGAAATMSEIWDPATGAWTEVGSIGSAEVPGMALLGDGRALIVAAKRTHVFNPVTGELTRKSDLDQLHRFGATVALGDGRIMVIGGEGTATCEIYRPDLDLWRPAPSLSDVRAVPSAVVLPTGHVVAAGGAGRTWGVGSKVEIFDPVEEQWTLIRPMAVRRLAHTTTVLRDGSVLVTGGTASVIEEPYFGQSSVERFRIPVPAEPARGVGGRRIP